MNSQASVPIGNVPAEAPAVLAGRKAAFWKALLEKEPKVKEEPKPYVFLARMPREQMMEIEKNLGERREIRNAAAKSLAKIFPKINGDDIVELLEYARDNCNSDTIENLEKRLYSSYAGLPGGAKTEALNRMMVERIERYFSREKYVTVLCLIGGLPEEMLTEDLKAKADAALSCLERMRDWNLDLVAAVIGLPESMRKPGIWEKAREKYAEIVKKDNVYYLEAIMMLPRLPEEFRTNDVLSVAEGRVVNALENAKNSEWKESALEAIPVLSRYIDPKKLLSAARKAMRSIVKDAKRETVIDMLSNVGGYPKEVQGSIVRAALFSEYPSVQIRAAFRGAWWLVSKLWKGGKGKEGDFPHLVSEEGGEDE